MPEKAKDNAGAYAAGTAYSNVRNASISSQQERFHASRGHGFAAEQANTLHDKLTGHDAVLVGENNAKNGADRMVDGVNIQSKYCSSGSKCIAECFKDGQFRYMNTDGTPMQIEVPSDKYQDAIRAMEERIRRGQIPGITNPDEAKNIVRQGKFSYEQAKNIAKAGTIDSLKYDAVNGSIIATTSFGITAVLSFATSIWNGEDIEVALINAVFDGLKISGITFATAILAGQLTKSGLNSMLVGSSEAIVQILGTEASATLVSLFQSGSNIGAAATKAAAAKVLRTNAVTGIASVVVLSGGDIVNIFRGRISGAQLFKNVASTTSSVAGGTAGWIGGATAGAAIGSVVPVIGTGLGGIIGGLAGAFGAGSLANNAANKVLNNFIEDDADKMVRLIESVFVDLASDYLLTKNEVEHIVERISKDITGNDLKDIYANDNRKQYVKMMLLTYVEREISHREKISSLSNQEMQKGLRLLLENIADSEEYQKSLEAGTA